MSATGIENMTNNGIKRYQVADSTCSSYPISVQLPALGENAEVRDRSQQLLLHQKRKKTFCLHQTLITEVQNSLESLLELEKKTYILQSSNFTYQAYFQKKLLHMYKKRNIDKHANQTQWLKPVIPTLGNLRQEDCYHFEDSLGSIMSPQPAKPKCKKKI